VLDVHHSRRSGHDATDGSGQCFTSQRVDGSIDDADTDGGDGVGCDGPRELLLRAVLWNVVLGDADSDTRIRDGDDVGSVDAVGGDHLRVAEQGA
jgi:hypothetical protein